MEKSQYLPTTLTTQGLRRTVRITRGRQLSRRPHRSPIGAKIFFGIASPWVTLISDERIEDTLLILCSEIFAENHGEIHQPGRTLRRGRIRVIHQHPTIADGPTASRQNQDAPNARWALTLRPAFRSVAVSGCTAAERVGTRHSVGLAHPDAHADSQSGQTPS